MVDAFKRDLVAIKAALIVQQTRRAMVKESFDAAVLELAAQEKYVLDAQKASIIIQAVASDLQQNLEFRITNIVTMALASVFPNPYQFGVKFTERRSQLECDMWFIKDGNECDPMEGSGGGAKDIASLALRMAIWSIRKTRAIQILDEPAKFLSRDMQVKASEMIKMISEELGIQMIIVSHIPEMIEAADRVINVDNVDGYCKVTQL